MRRFRFDPTDPKSFIAYTFFAFLVALLGALTIEFIKKPADWSLLWLLDLAAIAIMLWIFDPLIVEWVRQRRLPAQLRLTFPYLRPAKGLLLLVSKGPGAESARSAVNYHGKHLSHVWLVYSSGSETAAGEIEQHCKTTVPGVTVNKRKLDDIFFVDCIERAKSLVDAIRKEATRAGLRDEEFVCDFTGMNKLAGAGVVLACIRREHRLQYMQPNKLLSDGKPDPQAGANPVEIDVNYDASLT